MISPSHARQLLVLALFLYGIVCLRDPETFRLLDNVDLAIHETGHLVFAPFGEFLGFLGGTLFQLLFPVLFYVYFRRQQDRFAASVILWWVAQNLWNISVYMADARAQRLPLVGGGEHDWAYLLGRMGLLQYDQALANAVQFAGALLFFWAMLRAFQYSTASEGAQKAALPQL